MGKIRLVVVLILLVAQVAIGILLMYVGETIGRLRNAPPRIRHAGTTRSSSRRSHSCLDASFRYRPAPEHGTSDSRSTSTRLWD